MTEKNNFQYHKNRLKSRSEKNITIIITKGVARFKKAPTNLRQLDLTGLFNRLSKQNSDYIIESASKLLESKLIIATKSFQQILYMSKMVKKWLNKVKKLLFSIKLTNFWYLLIKQILTLINQFQLINQKLVYFNQKWTNFNW